MLGPTPAPASTCQEPPGPGDSAPARHPPQLQPGTLQRAGQSPPRTPGSPAGLPLTAASLPSGLTDRRGLQGTSLPGPRTIAPGGRHILGSCAWDALTTPVSRCLQLSFAHTPSPGDSGAASLTPISGVLAETRGPCSPTRDADPPSTFLALGGGEKTRARPQSFRNISIPGKFLS